jgi:hypothetical protein
MKRGRRTDTQEKELKELEDGGGSRRIINGLRGHLLWVEEERSFREMLQAGEIGDIRDIGPKSIIVIEEIFNKSKPWWRRLRWPNTWGG